MLRRLPPLNALKAFEAAARHESFTRAAEELFVTQGAVSHQVKALEAELGVKLFNRERQRLTITQAGRDYLTILRDAFDRIAVGTESLLQRQSSGALTVSTSPDFAAKWLVNRLGRFAEKHAKIDLRVSATLHHVDFAREDVDLAVRHGDGNWPGLEVVRLSAEQLFPVCSPKLLVGRRRLAKPADVLKFPLIHVDDRKDWTRWLEAAGVDSADSRMARCSIGSAWRSTQPSTDRASRLRVRPWRLPISSMDVWCAHSRRSCAWQRPIGSSVRKRLRCCPR